MNPSKSAFTVLLGTASFLTLATSLEAQAQQLAQAQTAQAGPEEVPEQVLITGSLIRGTAAVGVPVTNLSPSDFRMTGALTTSDLFRTIPQFNVIPGPVATGAANAERGTRVNLRQLDTGSAPRNLLMVDGIRYPPQGAGLCQIDPSIIPTAAIERIDLLLDGASATYGSDALGGVINIILKRNYDGAVTEIGFKTGRGGGNQYLASQLWGRTWDGGGIVLGYNWFDVSPTPGKAVENRLTFDHSPYGLDNRNPLGASMPGTISTGALAGGAISPDTNAYPATNGHNCTNCYAIPAGTGSPFNAAASAGGIGPLNPFSGATLRWNGTGFVAINGAGAAGSGPIHGTDNEFNPYSISDYSAALQYTGATMTIDQRLTRNVRFYGEGIYGMRRSQFRGNGNQQASIVIPTWNPYYPLSSTAGVGVCTTNPSTAVPAGVPAGCVPNNLRVNYSLNFESPTITNAYATGQRYAGGLNIELPGDWAAQMYYSQTRDAEFNHNTGGVNKGLVSAALGWTLPATAGVGTTPTIATWAKPATVPYLNVFCDPRSIACNSGATLAYIQGYSVSQEYLQVNEKGVKADGPLFDVPAGQVKAAIGSNYTSYRFVIQSFDRPTSNPTVSITTDPQQRQVWAVFAQVNMPIIGDANALPGVRKLEIETSWRHDQYYGQIFNGGTSNPKLAFNWGISDDLGLTVRGAWGQSFRAPSFGEYSTVSNVGWNGWGLPSGIFTNNSHINVGCDASGNPTPYSGGAKLFAAGFRCGSEPSGLSLNGGARAAVDAHWRTYFNQDAQTLQPETSLNYSLGFDVAPTTFLRGLDVQATWYSIKIGGILRNFGNPTTNRFNDGSLGFVYVTPEDVGCPAAQNTTPALCAPFMEMVDLSLAHPSNNIPTTARTLIYWINDGGTMNRGFQKTQGIDFTVSYDFDAGDFGAWNTGITGTYYLKEEGATYPGFSPGSSEVLDTRYHTNIDAGAGLQMFGVESIPRFKYRARLGWSNGPWSVTGFMDYAGHFFHSQPSPPNVNNQCLAPGGSVGGGTFPCLISDYTNIEPSWYTFDLSAGYDTGDVPANDYLKNVSIQLVVQNLFDKRPAYEYRISTGGGNPAAFDILKNAIGRTIQMRIVKTW